MGGHFGRGVKYSCSDEAIWPQYLIGNYIISTHLPKSIGDMFFIIKNQHHVLKQKLAKKPGFF